MNDSHLFESERLLLRAFEPEDAPALHAYLNHPALAGCRYIPGGFSGDAPLSHGQAGAIIAKWGEGQAELNLAVTLKSTGEIIGHALCDWDWDPHCPFVAVVIAPERQRQGYGSEVLRLLLCYLFENTPAYNVSSWIPEWNKPARELARRQGFQECGGSRREGFRQGECYDEIVVDLLKPEWKPCH